jgi:hypothetical protein
MNFSPFNPIIWLIFIVFCAATWLAVKLFHSRYPDYPGYPDDENGFH